MRRITAEERALFLAAMSGRLPAPKPVSVSGAKANKVQTKLAASTDEAMLAGHRRVTEEELELFLEAIGRRPHKPSAPTPVIVPVLPVKRRLPKQSPGGIDGNTKRRLEKGDIDPSAKLDLHGMTESTAHGALLTFLHTAHRRGDRLVVIVTGKGPLEETAPKARYGGVLRRAVPRWLDEAPMASIIADKRWAHRRHGGEGALYIYLRKR
jgi:DNA-nicking Smr family endonuclease